MAQVLLYFKKVKTKDGNKFELPLVRLGTRVFDATIKKETLEDKIKPDMRIGKLKYPLVVELGELPEHEDYFIKTEGFVRQDGTKGTKKVICILDYRSISQGEFPKAQTLDELVADLEGSLQNTDSDIPF